MNSFLLSLSLCLLPGHTPKWAQQNTAVATLGDKSSETLSDMEKAKNSVPPSFPTTHTHTHTHSGLEVPSLQLRKHTHSLVLLSNESVEKKET